MTIVNGHMLKNAIRQWEIRRNMLKGRFEESIWAFADEKKPVPEDVMKAYMVAENAIASLQTAQAEYNGRIRLDNGITITEGVKRIGGYVRMSSLWRGAMADSGLVGYFRMTERTRKKEEEQSKKQISDEDAFEKFAQADKIVNKMRSDIAEANGTELDITWLDQDWLDVSS